MTPPEREITEEEWIAASQACCGIDPVEQPTTDAGGAVPEGAGADRTDGE
jgi:hypothetical protein